MGGADSSCWTGEEVVYRKVFYAATPDLDQSLLNLLSQLSVRRLEKREKVLLATEDVKHELALPIDRAGLMNAVLTVCEVS